MQDSCARLLCIRVGGQRTPRAGPPRSVRHAKPPAVSGTGILCSPLPTGPCRGLSLVAAERPVHRGIVAPCVAGHLTVVPASFTKVSKEGGPIFGPYFRRSRPHCTRHAHPGVPCSHQASCLLSGSPRHPQQRVVPGEPVASQPASQSSARPGGPKEPRADSSFTPAQASLT